MLDSHAHSTEMASTVDEFELYVCLETRRSQNIGTLVRCAAAFGATALIIVGSDRVGSHGAHGAQALGHCPCSLLQLLRSQ